jgi:hypothetical protein
MRGDRDTPLNLLPQRCVSQKASCRPAPIQNSVGHARISNISTFGWIWETHNPIETPSSTLSVDSVKFPRTRPQLRMSRQTSIHPAMRFLLTTHTLFLDSRPSIIVSLSMPHNSFHSPRPALPHLRIIHIRQLSYRSTIPAPFSIHQLRLDPRSTLSHRIYHQPLPPNLQSISELSQSSFECLLKSQAPQPPNRTLPTKLDSRDLPSAS